VRKVRFAGAVTDNALVQECRQQQSQWNFELAYCKFDAARSIVSVTTRLVARLLFVRRNSTAAGNSLSGTLPRGIGALVRLSELRLATNELGGELPSEIGLCTPLSVLQLQANSFASTLPAELWLLTNLQYLCEANRLLSICLLIDSIFDCRNLDKNDFAGTVSPEISRLSALVQL
jgi:hypothetical protein